MKKSTFFDDTLKSSAAIGPLFAGMCQEEKTRLQEILSGRNVDWISHPENMAVAAILHDAAWHFRVRSRGELQVTDKSATTDGAPRPSRDVLNIAGLIPMPSQRLPRRYDGPVRPADLWTHPEVVSFACRSVIAPTVVRVLRYMSGEAVAGLTLVEAVVVAQIEILLLKLTHDIPEADLPEVRYDEAGIRFKPRRSKSRHQPKTRSCPTISKINLE